MNSNIFQLEVDKTWFALFVLKINLLIHKIQINVFGMNKKVMAVKFHKFNVQLIQQRQKLKHAFVIQIFKLKEVGKIWSVNLVPTIQYLMLNPINAFVQQNL